MPPARRTRMSVLLAAVLAMLVGTPAAMPAQALRTAIVDPTAFMGTSAPVAFERTRVAGATAVRLSVYWALVAPKRPANPTDPADPAYLWSNVDRQVMLARQNRLDPILSLSHAPTWAEGVAAGAVGTRRPDAAAFGEFARAVATRYSGSFSGLPRVRYFQVWNEPNISLYFTPQFIDGTPFSPGHYRRMVNETAAAVKAVDPTNLVVAGGTAPFRDITPDVQRVNPRWGPLTFMREFLCLDRSLRRTCSEQARVDVWAHHPYTSGGPTHHANLPDDVSLGDLPEMKRVLDAAVRARTVRSSVPVEFWVTEFSWDSNPPDPKGVPAALLKRWVAEGLYRMWRAGVSLVTWYSVRDEPLNVSFFQSSLFYRGATVDSDRPKPALQAFRFPVVAFGRGNRFSVWGRTPAGVAGRVSIQQTFRGGWKQLAVVRTNRHGIFERRFAGRATGSVRARLLGRPEVSRPFSLRPVRDRFFNPFGQETILEQPRR